MDRPLDPYSLIFFSNQIYKHEYLAGKELLQFIKAMLDLHLGFSFLFMLDRRDKISVELILDGCLAAIK